MAEPASWIKRVLWGGLSLVLAVAVVAFGALMYFGIPQNAAGMAAKGICLSLIHI
jgi:hypothetical protein